MIKVHVHVLGYGRAAREVYEQALLGGGCFGHLMRGSTEFSGHFFFSGSKSVARSSSYVLEGVYIVKFPGWGGSLSQFSLN